MDVQSEMAAQMWNNDYQPYMSKFLTVEGWTHLLTLERLEGNYSKCAFGEEEKEDGKERHWAPYILTCLSLSWNNKL